MNSIIYPNELLNEVELYEQLIEMASKLPWLTPSLLKTFEGLRDDRLAALDELTRPPRKNIMALLAEKIAAYKSQPKIVTREPVRIGYQYGGEFISCTCCLDIWRKLLRKLWIDYPEKREIMAASAKRFGWNRKYVASERKSLFVGKDDRWIRGHSRELVDGWYMDINVNPERIQKILPAMVSSAGLRWEEDVVVTWR